MELAHQLKFDFKCKHEEDSDVYVSHLVTNGSRIVGCGNGFIKLYDINTQQNVDSFGTGQKIVADICFCNNNPNILCTAARNGVICCYDLRTGNNAQTSNSKSKSKSKSKSQHQKLLFTTDSKPNGPNGPKAPFYSVACDNNIIAGGSDANVYLWDSRKGSKPYHVIDSFHTNEVCKLKFNPFHGRKDTFLCSASQDGLINEYNLQFAEAKLNPTNPNQGSNLNIFNNLNNNQSDDDMNDMILSTVYSNDLNGIWNFGFFKNSDKDYLYSISNVDTLDIYHLAPLTPMSEANESKQNDAMEMETESDENDLLYNFERSHLNNMLLVDCFYDYSVTNDLYLVSGSESGKLRLSRLKSDKMVAFTEFAYGKYQNPNNVNETREGGHLGRVRCCLFDDTRRLFFTGGEDNSICVWKFDPSKANGTIKDEKDPKVLAFLSENGMDDDDDEKNMNSSNYNTMLDNYKNDQSAAYKKQQNRKEKTSAPDFNIDSFDWSNTGESSKGGNGDNGGNGGNVNNNYGPHRGRF